MSKKGSTTVQSYKPTEQEIRLQKNAADYSDAISPNALNLNNVAGALLKDSYGTVQADYGALNQNAQNQIVDAQNTVGNLSQGVLSDAYKQNMQDAISSTLQNTMGETINNLGNRGVLNSSVTNQALNDTSNSVANATAQNYLNSLSSANGIAGQQAALAGQGITTTAAAQEAAQQPALNLWNASLGLNSGSTLGALQAVAGQGTTTSTQSGGGSGLLGGVLSGLAGNSALFCFTGDTNIKTPAGGKKIKHLKAGDKVICPNADGTETTEIVRDVMKPHESEVYALIGENDTRVQTTMSQPFMRENGDFVLLKNILPGETTLKGKGDILGIAYIGKQTVYDLKLTGENNYYANGFIAKGGTTEWGA